MSTETVGEGLTRAEVSAWVASHPHAQEVVFDHARSATLQAEMRVEYEARLRKNMNSRWVGLLHRLLNTSAYRRFKEMP